MTTAAYVRVSTTGQNEAGQQAAIERWLEGNNVTDVEWYIDTATGDNLDRPEFADLQADIFDGAIDTVVCFKLDRLSRTLKDGINVLCDWIDKGIRVVSVTQQLDFSGPTGKLIASVLFAVAEMEQETRREPASRSPASKASTKAGSEAQRKPSPAEPQNSDSKG